MLSKKIISLILSTVMIAFLVPNQTITAMDVNENNVSLLEQVSIAEITNKTSEEEFIKQASTQSKIVI